MSRREFDDVARDDPFVSSAAARTEIVRLVAESGCGITFNLGGAEIFRGHFHCQISGWDDLADLNKLRTALASLAAKAR